MSTYRVIQSERHVHFITFSCYKRRQYLKTTYARKIVLGHLGSALRRLEGVCVGFVLMPDHVHLLVWLPEPERLSRLLTAWKSESSAALKGYFARRFPEYWMHVSDDDAIWQTRHYGFNIWTRSKVEEKLDYMHLNPVRAGLVTKATDWLTSSARWHIDRKPVGIAIGWPPGLELDD